ncbi:cytochrome c-550 PedF [Sphingomonas kaistensis]|uniref:Cytochrome c-550 PedF n=2 Tax=Sphingomonas kaistensis TaxID=298708 RepID=A0ABZ2G6H5_9SPHN
MRHLASLALMASVATLAAAVTSRVTAHGNVVLQAVDTSALPDIGEAWIEKNPYRGNPKAIAIGKSAYNQNCARCHGLEGISGGIAPDLRYLDVGEAGDAWYIQRYHKGSSRDGKVYMPPIGDVLGQKAGWAIRSWLDTVHEE